MSDSEEDEDYGDENYFLGHSNTIRNDKFIILNGIFFTYTSIYSPTKYELINIVLKLEGMIYYQNLGEPSLLYSLSSRSNFIKSEREMKLLFDYEVPKYLIYRGLNFDFFENIKHLFKKYDLDTKSFLGYFLFNSEFEKFKKLFDFLPLENNDDFNYFLLHCTERNFQFFEYMISKKGNHIINYDKIVEKGNSEINSLIERIR